MGKVAQAIQRFELMTRPSLGMAQGARKQREMPALLRETKSSVGNADWAASLPKDLRRYCSEWVAGIAEGLNVVRVSVADVRVERGSHATASYHNVAAVTSTVCETPSISWIVTRQDRTDMGATYHIRFFFSILQLCRRRIENIRRFC
jgi:hypothetical protein